MSDGIKRRKVIDCSRKILREQRNEEIPMLNAPNGMPREISKSLGIQKMPKGYELWQDEDGYCWWFHPATQAQSDMHWSRWAIYRAAKLDSEER